MTSRHAALDELRGLAVLIVFLSHAANDALLPGWLGGGAGQMGVQLFFMLSGFLMLRLYGARTPTLSAARAFLLARAGRILPLYWLVLAISALAAGAGASVHYQVADGMALAAAAGLLVAPQELWSVPVEAQFYLIFLVLWMAVAGRGWRAALCWLVPLALLVAAAFRGGVSELALAPAFAPAFLIGMGLAALRLPATLGRGVLPWLALAFIALNLPGIRAPLGLELWSGFYPSLWLDPFRLGAAALLLASAAAAAPGRWLAGPPLAALGVISYGFYLFHRPVLRALEPLAAPGWTLAFAAFGLSAAFAALSWWSVEKPAAARIRAWRAPHPRPARQPSAR